MNSVKPILKRMLCDATDHVPAGAAVFPFTDTPGLVCGRCGAKAVVFTKPNGQPNIIWSEDWRVRMIKDVIGVILLAAFAVALFLLAP